MSKYFIGIDFGTQETKGCLTDFQGNVVSTARRGHQLIMPNPGFAEHDPEGQWWNEFKEIVQELKENSHINSKQIIAVCVSTVMAGICFLDDDLNSLRNAILYGIDTRSIKQVQKLNRDIGEEKLTSVCGGLLTIESFGAKILWVKENQPEVFSRTRHITFASGYINAKLTGKFAVDKYSATAATPMIDTKELAWNEEMCSFICPSDMLPKIVETTEVIGNVTRAAAEEAGLCEDTLVICGTTDAGAEAVSAGVCTPGDTMIMYGSTAFLVHVTKDRKTMGDLWSGPYVIPNMNCLLAGTSTAGSITTWMRNTCAKDLLENEKNHGINAFDTLFAEAQGINAGSDGLMILPYFMGQRMPRPNADASGMVLGLTLNHTRGHIMNAIFEGIGYNIAEILEMLGSPESYRDNVMAVGGGTKTPLYLQRISDICGITQTVPKVKIGASYGDTLLAGLGVGVFTSPEELKGIVKKDYVIHPDFGKFKKYRRNLDIYKRLYETTMNIMTELKSSTN